MNVTILTATIIVGTKETPLTKAIVKQAPFAEREFHENARFEPTGDCQVLGEVQIDNGPHDRIDYFILANTPRGLRKFDGSMKRAFDTQQNRHGLACIERIILLK